MTGVPTIPNIEAYEFYREEWDSYEQLHDSFEWEVPETFNIATYTCDRWAPDKGRVALFGGGAGAADRTYTFWELRNVTNRLANYLRAQGIERGDRIGVNTPQKPETAMAHIAAWKLGAVSIPLSTLFGPDAIEYRLGDAGAKACIVDGMNAGALREVEGDLDALDTVLTVDGDDPEDDEADFWAVQDGVSREFDTVETDAEDDAMILYTSGTTGPPKGVRHAHRVLLGHLPGFVASHCDFAVTDADVIWTPAEWAWIASVMATMAPALYLGRPVVAYDARGPFDAETAFEVIERYGVSVTFMPPTALRMMMQVDDPADRWALDTMRSIYSGGESLGADVADWAERVFEGATVHEVYGQTEANELIEEITELFPRREGSMGKPVPGHEVDVIDPETAEATVEVGEVGEIGVRYEGNPVCFKEYWNMPEKTEEKVVNGWLRTGDLARKDEDGYISFVSRKDDVIISSGYRIGPDEVEDTIASHPAVVDAGVIGIPDDERGQIAKAFVVLADGYDPSDELVEELQDYVKNRLAKYEYPREVEFIDELPMTVTGKVRRTDLRDREGL